MFDFEAYINMACIEKKYEHINLRTEKYGDVNAVFIDAHAGLLEGKTKSTYIDAEKGVCIDIEPHDKITRYMSDYNIGGWWCEPFFGKSLSDIPKQTQNIVFEIEDGSFILLLPVVNSEYKCVFEGKDGKRFTARLYSLCEKMYECNGLAFLYACGESPALLMEKCVKTALELLGNGVRSREERRYPEVFEYLGWCSWDAMQIRVDEEGMLQKCEEFKKKGIPVKWVILDDMWADVRPFNRFSYCNVKEMVELMHTSALYSYEAAPERFPNGLKGCIDKIKEYGLYVGIWLPNSGYWRGIDPDGDAYKTLKDYLITNPNGYILPDWQQDKSYMYYKTVHDFFRECGTDFVKIDRQSSIPFDYKGLAPIGRVAREYHSGMEASVGEHFDNAMINCMGMASEDMWNRAVSPISRCSDDFQPENREWFSKHILQCAYNSIMQGQFYWCDWDMWWTDDGQAGKNSLMRAISGGPIYVSDELGRSNKEPLEPLILSDGRILRCDRPCTPTSDCVTIDCRKEEKALKLQNMYGEHGIMALVNINEENKAVSATICGENIDGFEADEYAVYEHFTRELKILRKGESFETVLKNNDDYKLYIFAPLNDGFGVIGRTNKYISPATVERVWKKDVILKEDGEYAYIEDRKLIFKDGMEN